MNSRTLPLLGAAALGFALAALCFTAATPRPAGAQFPANKVPIGQPLGQINVGQPGTPAPPQPIEIQALDETHFVVATREPRLVEQLGREGTAQNMLVTVVTYYTVRGERLVPVEHVRVPPGYRALMLEE